MFVFDQEAGNCLANAFYVLIVKRNRIVPFFEPLEAPVMMMVFAILALVLELLVFVCKF